jgi:hypothetical protein
MASIFKKIEVPEMSSFTRRLSCLRAYPDLSDVDKSWSQDAKQIDQKVKMPPQQPVWQGFGRSHFLIPVDPNSLFSRCPLLAQSRHEPVHRTCSLLSAFGP